MSEILSGKINVGDTVFTNSSGGSGFNFMVPVEWEDYFNGRCYQVGRLNATS